jgi:hypothetical protein
MLRLRFGESVPGLPRDLGDPSGEATRLDAEVTESRLFNAPAFDRCSMILFKVESTTLCILAIVSSEPQRKPTGQPRSASLERNL